MLPLLFCFVLFCFVFVFCFFACLCFSVLSLRKKNLLSFTLSFQTSTHLSLSLSSHQVNFPEISDKDFKKPAKVSKAKTEGEFFEDKKEKAPLPEAVKANQKQVDAAIIEAAKAVPHMTDYLHSRFTLRNGEFPHLMKF